MKKKKLILAVMVIVIVSACVAVLTKIGQQLIINDVQIVTVELDSFRWKYKTHGVITSQKHEYFFEGSITSAEKKVTERISKDETILKYRDAEGNQKELKSEIDGYLEDISTAVVVISDLNYYLKVMLRQQQFDLISDNCQALFETGEKEYLAVLQNRNDYGIRNDESVCYEADFSLDSPEGLHINQQGNVTLLLDELQDVLSVDDRAVFQNREGTFLIREEWLKSKGNSDDYTVKVNVIAFDNGKAYLSDQRLEGLRVCILSDGMREMLEND